eukprot:scaffold179207_cov46-Attheya_sp.AAC.2
MGSGRDGALPITCELFFGVEMSISGNVVVQKVQSSSLVQASGSCVRSCSLLSPGPYYTGLGGFDSIHSFHSIFVRGLLVERRETSHPYCPTTATANNGSLQTTSC